jgi:uroporphyrinogen-III synthase
MLDQHKISYSKAIMYRTVSEDMTFLDLTKYDLLIFFSPAGIRSLFKNFPDFTQGEKSIGVFGQTTATAAREAGLSIMVEAPTPTAPSMAKAIEQYLTACIKAK